MRNTKTKSRLSVVEVEYVKLLKPELQQAIEQGEPERAAAFAKEIARLQWRITPCPELLTEEEVIMFLRIPMISKSPDYHNVIENLKRMHGLPRIHICGKLL